jgi:outer membrane biosynthesis protein TonB
VRRIMSWLALVIALAVIVLSALELDNRAGDDDQLALEPTILPSPTSFESPDVTETPEPDDTGVGAEEETIPPDETPEETVEGTAEAQAPQTSVETPTPEPTPTDTIAPPRTPTPEPALTPGNVDTSGPSTPTTGGGAVPNGVFIASVAIALRALIGRRRRSY